MIHDTQIQQGEMNILENPKRFLETRYKKMSNK